MKIHPRTRELQKARSELNTALAEVIIQRKLTPIETVTVILEIASWWSREYMRLERNANDTSNTDNTEEHLEEAKQ